MVKLKDIAEKVGVSISTVSAVINNNDNVADETKKKVQKAVKELGYRKNYSASSLRNGETKNIVYIVPSVTNLVFAQFIHDVQQTLTNYGYDLILLNNEARRDLTESYLKILKSSKIDGVIMTQTSTCGKLIAKSCQKLNIPFVVLLAPGIFENANLVLSEDFQGTSDAVEYLLNQGHTNIGFLMVKDSKLHTKRLKGYKNALENNLTSTFKEDLIIECNDHTEIDAYVHFKEYVNKNGLNFSALIACNDFMSFGVMRYLKEKKIKIPEDISIIGYDDSIAKYLSPTLSTITIPKKLMAKKAVDLLINQINDKSTLSKKIVFPQNLIIRDSVKMNNSETKDTQMKV